MLESAPDSMNISSYSGLSSGLNHKPYSQMIKWIGIMSILFGAFESIISPNLLFIETYNASPSQDEPFLHQAQLSELSSTESFILSAYILMTILLLIFGFTCMFKSENIERDIGSARWIRTFGLIMIIIYLLLNSFVYGLEGFKYYKDQEEDYWNYVKFGFDGLCIDVLCVFLCIPFYKYHVCNEQERDQYTFWITWAFRYMLFVCKNRRILDLGFCFF